MADMTPASVATDAAANTVTSGAVRGAVTADAATTAFLGAVPAGLSASVYNLILTLAAAAQQVNAGAADANLLQTYPVPTIAYSSTDNQFNYTMTLRFKEPGQTGDNIVSLSD